MTSCDDDETLTITTLSVTKFQGGKEKKMASVNKVDVALTATMKGAKDIEIKGPTTFQTLGVDTGAWIFNFTLDDQTGKGVRFKALDAMDGSKACPASGTGNQSKLIVGEHVEPQDPKQAHFTDNNNNKAKDGVVDVSFQWNFTCDDSNITVQPYDPVVPNGGKT